VETLGLGEPLTSGGFVRRADGTVVLPEGTIEFLGRVAAVRDCTGKTMLQIAAILGNCDPAPAIVLPEHDVYVHTWSRVGFELTVGFGADGAARWIHEEVGGPVTERLVAAIEADAAQLEPELASVPPWRRGELRAENPHRLAYADVVTPSDTLRETEEKLRLTEEQLRITKQQLRIREEQLQTLLEELNRPQTFYGVSFPAGG
jgi:hypothetical protein